MKKTLSAAVLFNSTLLIAPASWSDDFNYSYLNLSAGNSEIENTIGGSDVDVERSTMGLLWSQDLGQDYWDFPPSLYFQLGYLNSEIDEINSTSIGGDVETDEFTAYLGMHQPIMSGLDYFAGIGYTQRFFSEDGTSVFGSDFFEDQKLSNYQIGGGVRYKPLQYLELTGSLFFVDFDTSDYFAEIDDDVAIDLSAIFHPNQVFAISVDYRTGFDTVFDDLSVSLRYKL